jgi:protein-tyrosine kinase
MVRLPFPTQSRRFTERPSYPWLSDRAQNALDRLTVISVVTGVVFVAVLIGLVLIPRQASRAAHIASTRIGIRADTATIVARRAQDATALARADSALAAARHAIAIVPPPVPVDTFPTALRVERDSLNAALTELNTAMANAAEAPLPPAFRALAQTSALQSSPQVHVWLDSLDMVDKLRAPFGALGAGDPIYVALTARVNELGRSIRDAADQKHSELLSRLAPLTPAPVAPPPPSPETPQIDTIPLAARRASIAHDYAMAGNTLDVMRARNAQIDTATTQARDIANIGASPAAMLAAALVLALVFGFSLTFASELRHPRVANPQEAERIAGTRVLTVIRSTDTFERNRRLSDSNAPTFIDTIPEYYRTLYLHLAATNASIPIVTVTGEIAPIVATVATNLATVASYEARSTLLIDVDTTSDAVASLLRIPSNPGLAGILAGTSTLTDAIVSTTIGRDHPLDVLPSGTGPLSTGNATLVDQFRADLTRLERRYDFIVIAAPTSYVQLAMHTIIPTADVILCARLGHTRLAELRAATKSLRGIGRNIHGVVLWDDDLPRI